jgi:hypothetical protein
MEKVQTRDMKSFGGFWNGDLFFFTVTRPTIHGIAKYDPNGVQGRQLSLYTGSQPGMQNGHVTEARYQNPTSICRGAGETITVADMENHVVRSISNDYVTTLVGTGVGGNQDGPVSGTGGPAASLNYPILLSESSDIIIISERNSPNKIRIFSRASSYLSTVSFSADAITTNPCIPTCLSPFGSDFLICSSNAIYQMVLPTNLYTQNAQALAKPLLALGPRAKFHSAQFLPQSGNIIFSIGSSLRLLTSDSNIVELKDLTLTNPSALPYLAVSEKNLITIVDQATSDLYASSLNSAAAKDPFSSGELGKVSIAEANATGTTTASNNSFSSQISSQSQLQSQLPSQSQSQYQPPSQSIPPSGSQPPSSVSTEPSSYAQSNAQQQGQQGQQGTNNQSGYGTPAPSNDQPTFDPYGSNSSLPSYMPVTGSGSGYPPPNNPSGYGYDSATSSPASTNPYAQQQQQQQQQQQTAQTPPSGFPPGWNGSQGSQTPSSYQQNQVQMTSQMPSQTIQPPQQQQQQQQAPPTNNFTAPPPTANVAAYSVMGQQQQYALPNVQVGGGPLPNPGALTGVLAAQPQSTFVAAVPVSPIQQPAYGYTTVQQSPTAFNPYAAVQTTQVVQAVPPVVAVTTSQQRHHHHHHNAGTSGKKNENVSSTGMWEWEASFETWTPYDANIHNTITGAYQDGKSKAKFMIGGTQYEIDFTVTPTRQVQSANKSKTRRVRGPASCPLPIIN